jgi:hypothetical protein
MAKDPIESLTALEKNLMKQVAGVLNKTLASVVRKLQTQHLTGGTTDSALGKRSGTLSREIIPTPAQAEAAAPTLITAAVHAGVKYAAVHFGPRGTAVTITPKNKQFLAIPTDFAKTPAGVAKGGPLDSIWGPTFINKGVIFGYHGGQKGTTEGVRQRAAAGQTVKKGEIIPLFILKKSVVVKRRIDPHIDLILWAKPKFLADLKKEALKVG